jgi:type I pantothenate kinase
VLQSPHVPRGSSRVFVSDYFDFSIYLDADPATIEDWYVQRFLRLRDTVFQNESSYFHRYAQVSEGEAVEIARRIWATINLPNLKDNIQPTRERAHLILEKGEQHFVQSVRLRRV